MNKIDNNLWLGRSRTEPPQPLTLKPKSLLRHMMALGSSGSGKTVLSKVVVEECVRHGLPAICVDPQGDLCSLALLAEDPEALAAKGTDPALAHAFSEKADVVVFTPASRTSVALSADPVQTDLDKLPARERVYALSATAGMIVSLLGYDLDSDDAAGLIAVFDRILNQALQDGLPMRNLADFSTLLHAMDDGAREVYSRYLDPKKLDQASRRLARLDVGARRLLFHEGLPLDIDLLLGRGTDSAAIEGKTRVSVIYLNTLNSQEDKEFFLAALTERLYSWMLKNPSNQPQALFYVDEVAPFIPPVRKPACKPALNLLFKQARKYGICCLMGTQNPGDVDYKAMAQFGTWALGRLTTRQDLAKIQPTVKALAPVDTDRIMTELPAQTPGQFILLSPDNFDTPEPLAVRWLYTRHETLDERRIHALALERWLTRFGELEARLEQREDAPESESAVKENTDEPPAPLATVESEPGTSPDLKDLERMITATAAEFAQKHGLSEGQARRILNDLLSKGLAERFKDGRSHRYWSLSLGLRPDLGLLGPVQTLMPAVTRERAQVLAETYRERRTLGLLGDDEELEELQLEYRLTLRVVFQEKIKHGLWKRLLGHGEYADLIESVYYHPKRLEILLFDPQTGVRFHQQPDEHASKIVDFDGATQVVRRSPGEIHFNEQEWRERHSDETLMEHLQNRFPARVTAVEPVFLPVWRALLSKPGQPGMRVVTLDGLSGNPLEW
ncbi:MAG: DUF853 family protein [Chromatiales bacterium]|nr:DUF853 family protein [Chromatiales bacterium]